MRPSVQLGSNERKDTLKVIVGSLIFMVAGFVFLMLGRGSEPNVFQFLSIASSLIAGTLLVMGYLRERKRRPAKGVAVEGQSSTRPASLQASEGIDVEADLKALEEGLDEEELQPADSATPEPLVSSVRTRKGSTRKTSAKTGEDSPVLEPAMAGAVSPHSVAGSSMGPSASAGAGGPSSTPEVERAGGESAPAAGSSSSSGPSGSETSGPQLSSANRQWASLISDVDEEKFEPPAFEKSKTKTKPARQGPESKGDPGKGNLDMNQSAAVASTEEPTSKPEKPRRGLFGIFKRKPAPAASTPSGGMAAGSTDEMPSTQTGMGTAPTQVSPEAAAEELSAAQKDTAQEMGKPEGGGPVSRPETAPIGEHLEAVAANAGGGPTPPIEAKGGARRKTAAKPTAARKPKTSAAKPRTGAKPKAPAKAKATAAKPKAAAAPKTAAKSKAAPAKRGAAKPAKTAGSKAKSPAKRKTRGPAGG